MSKGNGRNKWKTIKKLKGEMLGKIRVREALKGDVGTKI